MPNFSLTSLSVLTSVFSSPFISNTHEKSNIQISQSYFSKFNNPIFYSFRSPIFLNVIDSSFYNFLSSSIVIEKDMENLILKQGVSLNSTKKIINCKFNRCMSPTNGGGLSIHCNNVEVNRCFFQFCNCLKNGGALFICGNNAFIKSTCFSCCTAKERANVVFLEKSYPPSLFTDCTAINDNCGKQYHNFDTIHVNKGGMELKNFNFTKNSPFFGSAGFTGMLNNGISLLFCHLEKNSGASILSTYISNAPLTGSYLNMVNNSVKLALLFFSSPTTIDYSFFIFNHGAFLDNARSRSSSIIFDHCFNDNWGTLSDNSKHINDIVMGKHDTLNAPEEGFQDICNFRQSFHFPTKKMIFVIFVIFLAAAIYFITYAPFGFLAKNNTKRKLRKRPGTKKMIPNQEDYNDNQFVVDQ
ncbi:hypothetical protein TRFO_03582 [Tritrichomonas foetus]|uniref:Right handed beta helix domain-containing protein n=1 Tax=Tritrichomonas foetus TaxID=1144522 RepID=A0A1J4KMP4_9EUKA|nr:hypothetical protein TRFO_03582 [Tritrichomonas foetus]|eukprot:OHT12577.1 hypothetical protein TRFO_03582 [Tritrichomonas foetus]